MPKSRPAPSQQPPIQASPPPSVSWQGRTETAYLLRAPTHATANFLAIPAPFTEGTPGPCSRLRSAVSAGTCLCVTVPSPSTMTGGTLVDPPPNTQTPARLACSTTARAASETAGRSCLKPAWPNSGKRSVLHQCLPRNSVVRLLRFDLIDPGKSTLPPTHGVCEACGLDQRQHSSANARRSCSAAPPVCPAARSPRVTGHELALRNQGRAGMFTMSHCLRTSIRTKSRSHAHAAPASIAGP